MKRTTIGGQLGLREMARLYRPQSREDTRAAVIEMRARGMSDYGIAAATQLSVEQVRRLIGEGHT